MIQTVPSAPQSATDTKGGQRVSVGDQFRVRKLNTPLDRITPPSLVSKNWNGSFGLVTSACWSGCSPFGCSGSVASIVMSVAVTPASVDSTTPRLFENCSP